MMPEEHITEIPDEYFDKNASDKVHDEVFKELVNKHPNIFPGEQWDKYREKQEEEESDVPF